MDRIVVRTSAGPNGILLEQEPRWTVSLLMKILDH